MNILVFRPGGGPSILGGPPILITFSNCAVHRREKLPAHLLAITACCEEEINNWFCSVTPVSDQSQTCRMRKYPLTAKAAKLRTRRSVICSTRTSKRARAPAASAKRQEVPPTNSLPECTPFVRRFEETSALRGPPLTALQRWSAWHPTFRSETALAEITKVTRISELAASSWSLCRNSIHCELSMPSMCRRQVQITRVKNRG
eukprot:6180304-Pleurochrysis_carterae.AAC.1